MADLPNLLVTPPNLPAPEDDGACDHLPGLRLPDLALPSTAGGEVALGRLTGRVIVYFYPRTGQPGVALPDNWDAIAGARGCTPEACNFRDHRAELLAAGVGEVYGVSTQDSAYQREAAERLHLPFPLLSDERLALARALRLPTFEAAGAELIKRLTLVVDDGVITKCFYPVFPSETAAEVVLAWVKANP
ncbi:MAG: peroxiredoxin [Verrucomicrobia bacterium]|nr:peroxiredoxin [Verrucomicrobiota bacterium]